MNLQPLPRPRLSRTFRGREKASWDSVERISSSVWKAAARLFFNPLNAISFGITSTFTRLKMMKPIPIGTQDAGLLDDRFNDADTDLFVTEDDEENGWNRAKLQPTSHRKGL